MWSVGFGGEIIPIDLGFGQGAMCLGDSDEGCFDWADPWLVGSLIFVFLLFDFCSFGNALIKHNFPSPNFPFYALFEPKYWVERKG